MGSMFGNTSSVRPVYVIAKDYTGASVKATMYLKDYLETNPEVKSILDSDGSLKKTNKSIDIQITAVKLLSDHIIY